MMKQKSMKRVGLLLVLLALLLIPSMALAADVPAIGVQLNGEDVVFPDASPVNENGRVYVPFRAVFEALDATVDFRADDGLIMAEKDGTQVTFKVDQNTVNVNNGVPTTITIDAAPFIRDGRTYVPVRFAAQTLGLEVGWDGDAQTVVMLDKAELKEASKGQYTLMDQYMSYAKAQKLTGSVKANGDLKFEMQMASGSGSDAVMIPIKGTVKVDGITSTEASNMKMAMTLNLDELKAAMQELEALTAEDQAVFNAMEQIDMQVIVDAKGGKTYMKSSIFAMAGMDGNTWYKMDLNQTAAQSGMDLQQMLESEAADLDSYEASVMKMIDSLTPESASVCELMIGMLDLYCDDSFQRVGNNYISSMKYDMDGMAMSISITVKTNGSAVTGYQQAATMYMGTAPMMTLKTEQTGSKMTMDMNMSVQGILTMKVNGDLRYTATSEKAPTAPPAGTVILDLTA